MPLALPWHPYRHGAVTPIVHPSAARVCGRTSQWQCDIGERRMLRARRCGGASIVPWSHCEEEGRWNAQPRLRSTGADNKAQCVSHVGCCVMWFGRFCRLYSSRLVQLLAPRSSRVLFGSWLPMLRIGPTYASTRAAERESPVAPVQARHRTPHAIHKKALPLVAQHHVIHVIAAKGTQGSGQITTTALPTGGTHSRQPTMGTRVLS